MAAPESQSASVSAFKFPRDDPIWTDYDNEATHHDAKMIEGWTQSLDMLLVFAALISGVVTSFLIQAFTGLERNTLDVTNEILTLILQQLASSNNGTSAIPDVTTPPQQPFVPDQGAILINSLLFASLACCIIASVGALLAKLWLIEYRKDVRKPGGAYDRALNRQKAFGGLKAWRVGAIIEILPNIVLVAMILFYVALHVFIGTRQWQIAYGLGVASAIAITFGFTTSLAAAFMPNCPFRTPFSRALRFSLDLVLPKDTHIAVMPLAFVSIVMVAACIYLTVYVSPEFTALLFVPGITFFAMFRDIKETDEGHPLIGLPVWLSTWVTTGLILLSIIAYWGTYHLMRLISCTIICALWGLQGFIMARFCSTIPATLETEALAWILQKKLGTSPILFKRAALNADTEQRRVVLSHSLFPLLSSLVASHLEPPAEIQETDISELESYISCIAQLLEFKLRKASLRENQAAIVLPEGLVELKKQLGHIYGDNRFRPFADLRTRANDALGKLNKLESSVSPQGGREQV